MVFLNLQYPILFGTGVPDKEMGDKKFQERNNGSLIS